MIELKSQNPVQRRDPNTPVWTLSEYGEDKPSYVIAMPECIVGRGSDAGFRIHSSSVSKHHAKLFCQAGVLYVEDLSSTNGTYIGGEKVKVSALTEGDLLQFADSVFRVGCQSDSIDMTGTLEVGPSMFASALLMFEQLLTERRVIPNFQPIVTMDGEVNKLNEINELTTIGSELLARSDLEELRNPAAMFGAAQRLGQQATLSELMREEGSRKVCDHPLGSLKLFYNTHPAEFGTDRLDASLRSLRDEFPSLDFVIEVHESAIAGVQTMRRFLQTLEDLNMEIAYDDFGAGQGRLIELTEVPANYLKFDMGLIRDIDKASAPRQDLLRSLVKVAVESGSTPLAEGVETEAEHQTCRQLGFELGQGYLYGRPSPLAPQ